MFSVCLSRSVETATEAIFLALCRVCETRPSQNNPDQVGIKNCE